MHYSAKKIPTFTFDFLLFSYFSPTFLQSKFLLFWTMPLWGLEIDNVLNKWFVRFWTSSMKLVNLESIFNVFWNQSITCFRLTIPIAVLRSINGWCVFCCRSTVRTCACWPSYSLITRRCTSMLSLSSSTWWRRTTLMAATSSAISLR